jgi:hypothetical protein
MRRVLVGALVIGACVAVQSASAGTAARSCAAHPGQTLVKTHLARAYTFNGDVYACALPAGVAYDLGSATVCNIGVGTGLAEPVALGGKLVAYALERCGVDTGTTEVIVRRLTNGKRVHSDPATTGATGPESYETVESLVVKHDGSDAWIAVANSLGTHATGTEVHAHGKGGFVLLDSGSGIDAKSLRLKGSKLSWLDGGVKRSAKLR